MTTLGIVLRQLRWDRNELLRDMAKKLNVSSAFLSAVETGKKRPPAQLIDNIIRTYELPSSKEMELRDAVAQTTNEVKIDLTGVTPSQQQVAVSFAKALGDLTDEQIKKIMTVFSARQKR